MLKSKLFILSFKCLVFLLNMVFYQQLTYPSNASTLTDF